MVQAAEAPEADLASDGEAVAVAEVDPVEARFKHLDLEIRRLWIRNTDFRNKIFALQKVLVEQAGLTECEIGHPAAEIFPLEVRRDAEAPARVFIFGSMGANMGLQPKQFFQSFRGKSAEIYFFKDFKQCWYQKGLLGITDSVPATIEYLKNVIGDDPRPISMVGASSGGFAALMFGAILGAKKVVAFSPQSLITHRVFHRFKTEDSELGDIKFNEKYADLKALLTEHPLNGTADIYFSRRAPFDASEAQYLEGLQGVTLRPLEWNGHNTAVLLRNKGQLDAVINELVNP